MQTISAEDFRLESYEARKDLEQQAQEAVSKLTQVVGDRTESTLKELTELSKNLEAFARQTVGTATVLLENSVTNSLKQIADVKEDAIAHGLNPGECLGNIEEEIKNFPVSIIGEMVTCENNQIAEANAAVKNATKDINALQNIVYKLTNKLSGCGIGITAIQCYMDVLTEATKQISSLPGKIISIELKASATIDEIKIAVINCSIVRANEAETEVSTKTESITDCIKNLSANSFFYYH